MSKILPIGGFYQLDRPKFDLDKCNGISSRGCVLEFHFEYPKEKYKFQNYYPLASDKVEIKREMLSDYQLKLLMAMIFLLVKSKN